MIVFDRGGYISLSGLWRDFENRFLAMCGKHALACMKADPYSPGIVFGTALDLCEDVFLQTFDTHQLSLVPPQGEIVHVEPVLAHSGARLLLKMTALESFLTSIFPDEAGPDGKWLKQMGSTAFCAANVGWLWPHAKGRSTGGQLEKVVLVDVFHTLPILFERSSFIIPEERPPWSNDLLEDSYVRNLWSEARGSAICLSDVSADEWKRLLTKKNVEAVLHELTSVFPEEATSESQSLGGRPRKLDDVIKAYQHLGLVNKNLTRKAELRLVETHLKNEIGISTLDRARLSLRKSKLASKDK